MLTQSWLFVRCIVRTLAFPIWAFALEVETLFLDGATPRFWQRLRLFPSKLGARITYLVLGGYHALRLEAATRHCRQAQDDALRRIVAAARDTAFGRDLKFAEIGTYEDFAARVPIMTYAQHEPYIERQMRGERDVIVPGKPRYYARSSGTTGRPKYIPVTADASRRSHRDVSLIWLYYLARRNSGFLDDMLVAIAGPAVEGTTPDGTPFGSTSGALRASLPGFMRRLYAVPEEVHEIADYHARYYCLALFSLKARISHIASANPSTLVLLFELIQRDHDRLIVDIEAGTITAKIALDAGLRRMLEAKTRPDPVRARQLRDGLRAAGRMDPAFYWPRLSSLACWKGGNAPLFLERLRGMIPDVVPIFDLGLLASEIRATVPVERLHHGGVPTLNRNFFEFVPVEAWHAGNRAALRLHELELGARYYVLITTDSGLYRYHINDIVRVVGHCGDTPELVFEQKGEGVTNLTGEKLYEQQVQLAVAAAALAVGTPLRFYLCLLNAEAGRYEFLTEFVSGAIASGGAAQRLLAAIDAKLGETNLEYRAKRDSLRLKAPRLHVLRDGAFERYRASKVRDGAREAQFKMVLLSANIEMLGEFEVVATHGEEQP
jgi:hypothetical protein